MYHVPDKDRWDEKALCRGTMSDLHWVWGSEPGTKSVDKCLSLCNACPVMMECRQEGANDMGPDPYAYQIVGGLRLWDPVDLAYWPESVLYYKYVPPKRPVGRPRGPLSVDYIAPDPDGTRVNFNPHTRAPHNTPTQTDDH